MVRTKYILVLNETINVKINDDVFRIKVVEDSQGPLRVVYHGTMKALPPHRILGQKLHRGRGEVDFDSLTSEEDEVPMTLV